MSKWRGWRRKARTHRDSLLAGLDFLELNHDRREQPRVRPLAGTHDDERLDLSELLIALAGSIRAWEGEERTQIRDRLPTERVKMKLECR